MPRGAFHYCPDCGGAVNIPPRHDRVRCGYCGSHLLYKKGLRGRSPLIAMDCPDCGAGVQVPEDAHTLRCTHCRTAHLLTGEGRSLRLYIPLSISAQHAMAQARRVLPNEPQPRKPTPIFVPYWRLHGTLFHWQSKTHRLRGKSLDRSIPAGDFGLGLGSLGGRLLRVDQRPFDRAAMQKAGRVLNPVLGEKSAEARLCRGAYHAYRDHDLHNELTHGTVVGRRMSLVFYPYWLMWLGAKRIVVDGACEGVLGPPGRAKGTGRAERCPGEIPSLIPARCPRCGGDFRIEGFESLYYCRHCQACWRPESQRLVSQNMHFVGGGTGNPANHIPIWRLKISIKGPKLRLEDQQSFRQLVPAWSYTQINQDPGKPFYLFVPAWGNRLNPRMSAVARRWTRQQPDLHFHKAKFQRVFRGLYGPREAEELAFITLLGVIHQKKPRALFESKLRIQRSELLLVPGKKIGREWVEPVCRTAIPHLEMAERSF